MPAVFSSALIRLLSLGLGGGSFLGLGGAALPTGPFVLDDFDRPFLLSYGSWEGAAHVTNGIAVLRGCNNRGGAGNDRELDLSACADFSPALHVRVCAANETTALRLLLRDATGRVGTWEFTLPPAAGEAPLQSITANDGASLAAPHVLRNGTSLDLRHIRQLQLQGDWLGEKALDLEVAAVLAVPPDVRLLAQRETRRQAAARETARLAESRAAARARIQRKPTSPEVQQVSAAAPDILGITVQAGSLKRFDLVPHVPLPGDDLEPGKTPALVWEDGGITEQPSDRILVRKVDGRPRSCGFLVGGRDGPPAFRPAEQIEGDPLEPLTIDDPASYRLCSPDDLRLAGGVRPLRVSRKTKPNDRALPNGELALRHVIYLHLPFPLMEGGTYEVEFPGLNTREDRVTYRHRSREVRTEALHASQIGYRPDDPFKRAFLSLWLGTGGACGFDGVDRFELLDSNGRTAYRGPVKLAMAADGTEQLRVRKNYSQTAVYHLDFSAFDEPGVYRVHVPGLGCSDPFPISDAAWLRPFQTSMQGFLHQRSGIELGPPTTAYRRPRNLHPADGVRVFASTTSLPEAEDAPEGWLPAWVRGRTDRVLPDAWGGYADAGNSNRRYHHLWATYLHLELLDCFPGFFRQLPLALPPAEAANPLPDILDEALWNIDFFRRLQGPDGGIRGGVESSAPPRAGEPSWMASLVVMAYAADPAASYLYAACAARAARLLERQDLNRSRTLRQSAGEAWTWAETNRSRFATNLGETYRNELRHTRASAAVELFWLIGEDALHEVFLQETVLLDPNPVPVIEQQGAVFAYSRLPRELGQDDLKDKARRVLLETADAAVAFSEGNAFGLTTEVPELPEIGPVGYFTVPGMISRSLPRAHFLSGDAKYLAGIVRSCNFAAGANPDNLTFTTGVGHRWPGAPLHIDSRVSSQPPPAGLTLCGASDPARDDDFSAWVHAWILGKVTVPDSRSWPATEAYVDLHLWPMMNESSIHQNLGPTSYTWGYLAARTARGTAPGH